MFGLLKRIFGTAQERRLRHYRRIVGEVNQWEQKFQAFSDDQLRAKTAEFRERLRQGASLDSLLPEAYAVVKNVCRRLCGTDINVSGYRQKWDMVPYDVQILGGIAMHHGSIAEMQTGEGKTLTATMPLYLNALTGKPVHLVTVNDYLAQRDCEWVGGVLRWLGLTTGALTSTVSPYHRRTLYNCDVVYGTASEFGFDYLRDHSMARRKEEEAQRGHYFAIIDETDSILIDEARTPLIISGPARESRQLYGELKDGVATLVRRQRDLCNRLATEARKILEQLGLTDEESTAPIKLTKEQEGDRRDALRKLWLVSKGTPRNKVLKRIREHPVLRDELDKLDLYYHGEQNKEERSKVLSGLLIIIDEKSSEYELTDGGIVAWEEEGAGSAHDFVMLDLGFEYAEVDRDPTLNDEQKLNKKLAIRADDAQRKERAHNLRQLLRAHLLMERDVDYMVHQAKVVIIDENTGRPQPGRRYSDGLHQAIEAKESVPIQRETQTYATVTLQNYFRMYEKLAGMTGTAITEAAEFKEIYKLDVLQIPTFRPCQRKDGNDLIYMTEREKYNAILEEVKRIHGLQRPILLGTESVDVSEKLSRILRQNGLPHTVLNAKYHDREAEIIAQAGQRGAITIATNMAGRGTDIKLGAGVAEMGGLHVIGASRHQSRRTDRQLRGRCARLGDPGSSVFFLSFEDPLMRLFASRSINALIMKLRPPEGEPISANMLNRSIQTAQKRVEQRNYMIRKHTLEYDDVMNRQRQEVYGFRKEVVHLPQIQPLAEELLQTICTEVAEQYLVNQNSPDQWNPRGYGEWLSAHFPVSFEEAELQDDFLSFEQLVEQASRRVLDTFHRKLNAERHKAGEQVPDEVMEDAMRSLIVRSIDHLWQEHLLAMDNLRSEVTMRTVGQQDPLLEFKHEAFSLFANLGHDLRKQVVTDLFRFEILTHGQRQEALEQLLAQLQLESQRSLAVEERSEAVREALEPPSPAPSAQPAQASSLPRVGRNEACPCGSGKKYKRCCGELASEV
jgi:preprotein translocase subunit SecA